MVPEVEATNLATGLTSKKAATPSCFTVTVLEYPELVAVMLAVREFVDVLAL